MGEIKEERPIRGEEEIKQEEKKLEEMRGEEKERKRG